MLECARRVCVRMLARCNFGSKENSMGWLLALKSWTGAHTWLQSRLSLDKKISETSIKIIKNEVGCRDDTVPKTVGTRRHCEEK